MSVQGAVELANWQLLTVVGLPTLTSLIGFLSNNARISDLNGRISSLESEFNTRFASLESRLEILTGKVAELTDRVARIEAKLNI